MSGEQRDTPLPHEAAEDQGSSPIELWIGVRCADTTDQAELAERFRAEGRVVVLRAGDDLTP